MLSEGPGVNRQRPDILTPIQPGGYESKVHTPVEVDNADTFLEKAVLSDEPPAPISK